MGLTDIIEVVFFALGFIIEAVADVQKVCVNSGPKAYESYDSINSLE